MALPTDAAKRLQTMRAATHAALRPTHPVAHLPAGRTVSVAAPGRINLIGEHTDYNEGWVLPLAIDRWVVMSGRARDDRVVRVTALDRNETTSFSLEALDALRREEVGPDWATYVAGVLWALQGAGMSLSGMEIAFTGDVPQGMGLSSSAALEVATGWLARGLFGLNVSRAEIALLSQKAENDFVGVACGMMDQFTSALGRNGHALLLDCRTREYRSIPFPEREAELVVVYGAHGRELVDSGYNTRRQQCDRAAAQLRRSDPAVRTLRDAHDGHLRWLDQQAEGLPFHHERAVSARRARHVVGENRRVLDAVSALERRDVKGLGALLNASHESLSDLFEVSTDALDQLVRQVQQTPGCAGARMVGGGFGGAVLALVEREQLPAFQRHVGKGKGAEEGTERVAGGRRIMRCSAQDGVRTCEL